MGKRAYPRGNSTTRGIFARCAVATISLLDSSTPLRSSTQEHLRLLHSGRYCILQLELQHLYLLLHKQCINIKYIDCTDKNEHQKSNRPDQG